MDCLGKPGPLSLHAFHEHPAFEVIVFVGSGEFVSYRNRPEVCGTDPIGFEVTCSVAGWLGLASAVWFFANAPVVNTSTYFDRDLHQVEGSACA